jgi:glutathione S-transferase
MSSNTLKSLTLHAHSTGPNPYKVAILLEALSLPYNVKLWTFADDSHGVKGPEFVKINPNGRVPALQDPNTNVTSWESMACVNYLLRVYDRENKFGAKPETGEKGKVEIEQWVSFLISTMGPMIGQCNWFRHYNAVKNEDAYRRYEAQVYRCLGVLEAQLSSHGGRWILDGFGVVDMHFEPWVRQYEYAELTLDQYPKIEAGLKAVQAVPEVVRAYEKVNSGVEA